MNQDHLEAWFEKIKRGVEEGYLSQPEPWRQSGFSGPEERWERLRRPIADCVDRSGTFLDIACANGYLLECLLKWIGERGLAIEPYGLDFSEKLVEMAKSRLSEHASNLFVGNALTWEPPKRFDFVRTELGYVPEGRLVSTPGGCWRSLSRQAASCFWLCTGRAKM